MIVRIGCLLLLASLDLAACTQTPALTKAEQEKLDPALRALIMNEDVDASGYASRVRADGERAYGVILTCDDAEALRAAGLPVASVFGDVVTAHLTVEEIRKAAALPGVRFIEPSKKTRPT